jgi:hypothetical protein
MMITTRNLKEPKAEEPKKLKTITTAIIPNAAPQPAPVSDGFAKMITTHDEPGPKFRIVIEPPDGKPLTGAARWIDDQFKADLQKAKVVEVKVGEPIDQVPSAPAAEVAPKPKAKKKGGRPKKAKA